MSDTFLNSFGDLTIPANKIEFVPSGAVNSGNKRYIGANDFSPVQNVTVTVESVDIAKDGYLLTIKDEEGVAFSNNITIETESSETIDGAANLTMNVNFQSVTLFARGGNLFTI